MGDVSRRVRVRVMRQVYEAWDDADGGISLTTAAEAVRQRGTGAISASARFLHRIEADTFEEAAAVHAIKMGWGAYHPSGEPAPCPQCGRWYYPEGSGECANCGPIR
jgi:type IV secretory pathway TrbL component